MMANRLKRLGAAAVLAGASTFLLLMISAATAAEFAVKISQVTDLKAVFARVEPVDVDLDRSRIGGTIAKLSVD